jgi:hypothetical protein
MDNVAHVLFRKEVRHFYLVSLLNIVFAAIVMAFGVAYCVSAVFDIINPDGLSLPALITVVLALACIGLGFSWLTSTTRVFEGIETISDDLEKARDPPGDDLVTCMMVRMLAHYRDNRTTIRRMILVCTLGGCCFFVLGIATGIQGLSLFSGGISITISSLPVIPAMLLTIGIALASLLSSYYFRRFSLVWDSRLEEIDESECALKKILGND